MQSLKTMLTKNIKSKLAGRILLKFSKRLITNSKIFFHLHASRGYKTYIGESKKIDRKIFNIKRSVHDIKCEHEDFI